MSLEAQITKKSTKEMAEEEAWSHWRSSATHQHGLLGKADLQRFVNSLEEIVQFIRCSKWIRKRYLQTAPDFLEDLSDPASHPPPVGI